MMGPIYCIGVGGMGMCPLAIYLKGLGYEVYGYDDNLSKPIRALLESGGVVLDKTGEHVQNCKIVVHTSAVTDEHVILKKAQAAGLEAYRRGEFLAKVLEGKKLIAVVGSHGKTSTAGMLIHALKKSGFEFSYLLGAFFKGESVPPAAVAEGDWVVAEIDESDGTIEHFSPEITLVINFDWDHPSRYNEVGQLEDTFCKLLRRTRQGVFIPHDLHLFDALELDSEVLRYKTDLDLEVSGNERFNQWNACAALSVVHYLRCAAPDRAFEDYPGIRRRQEVLFEDTNLYVMMDYAHHPNEVGPLLEHFVENKGESRLVVVFQPHRYTRTQIFYKEFANELERADELCLLPVYAASEEVLADGTTERIYEAISDKTHVHNLDFCYDSLRKHLPSIDESTNTKVLFLGAGDIEGLATTYARDIANEKAWARIKAQLSDETKYSEHESLAKKTTIRLGGEARFYVEPTSREELVAITKTASELGLPVFILGRGSNLIVAESGFAGLVIRLNYRYWRAIEPLDDSRIAVRAGARLKEICGFACKNGLAGFEFLEGIPGSLGGGLKMNAGAMGGWLFDVIDSVELLTMDGKIHTFRKEEMDLGYRYCAEVRGAVALSAIMHAPEVAESEAIRAKMDEFATHRKSTQPREPSAGCIFKNPEGRHSGQLIDEAGLKGHQIGGAAVSDVHGNFIINKGNATGDDVLALVKDVRARVAEKTGVVLEPEVLLLGAEWSEVLD